MDLYDVDRESPLLYAVERNNRSRDALLKALESKGNKNTRCMKTAGVNLSSRKPRGVSALSYTALSGRCSVVTVMLRCEAALEPWTPMGILR